MLTGRPAFRGETTLRHHRRGARARARLERPARRRRRPASGGCSSAASRRIRSAACATSATRASRSRRRWAPARRRPPGRAGRARCDPVGRGRGGRRSCRWPAWRRGSCSARSTSGGTRSKVRRSTRLTDFEGAEHHAAISRDGKFVAFLSDHDGTWDAWVSQVGTGDVHNLTRGSVPELRNPATRTVGFSPDGSLVTLWSRVADQAGGGQVDAGWAVPTMGGPLRPYLKGISELDWSPDGRRIVYHPPAPGDPLFVTEPDEKVGRQIYVARPGVHNHFPVWSPDGAFIYFVQGFPLDEMDVWRIPPTGGDARAADLPRLTRHLPDVPGRADAALPGDRRRRLRALDLRDGRGRGAFPTASARASRSTRRWRRARMAGAWWRPSPARRPACGACPSPIA